MTHSYVWHDSFVRVTWLIHTFDITHSQAWLDSFIRVAWLIHTCGVTHSYVTRLACLAHGCGNMTHSCMRWHLEEIDILKTELCGILTRICRDMTHSAWNTNPQFHTCQNFSFWSFFWYFGTFCLFCLPFLPSFGGRDSFSKSKNSRRARVTWLIDTCEMTPSYVWRDSFIRVTWLIHACNMTHWYMWHDSLIHATWLIHLEEIDILKTEFRNILTRIRRAAQEVANLPEKARLFSRQIVAVLGFPPLRVDYHDWPWPCVATYLCVQREYVFIRFCKALRARRQGCVWVCSVSVCVHMCVYVCACADKAVRWCMVWMYVYDVGALCLYRFVRARTRSCVGVWCECMCTTCVFTSI